MYVRSIQGGSKDDGDQSSDVGVEAYSWDLLESKLEIPSSILSILRLVFFKAIFTQKCVMQT